MTSDNVKVASPQPEQSSLLREILEVFRNIPDKTLFFALVLPWLAVFHFLGNSTFGYFDTPSLFGWLKSAYVNSTGDDEHGALVPWVILVILWWKRKEFAQTSVKNDPWMLPFLCLAMLFHLAGYVLQQPRFSAAALFLGIYIICGLVWGRNLMSKILFPFCLFVFAIPFSSIMEKITVPLRFLATHLTVLLTKDVLGIKVIEEGTQIFDAAHTFHYDVAAACSGIRSLLLFLFINTVFAFISFNAWWKRILIIVLAVPLAIVCNVLRLSSIIVAAEAFQQQGGDFVHEHLGIIFYIPAFAVLLVLNHLFSEISPRKAKI